MRQIKHKGNDDDYQEEDEDKFPLLGDEVLQSGNHDKSCEKVIMFSEQMKSNIDLSERKSVLC